MTDNTTPWNGTPDNPDQSGWHWIGYERKMEPFFWSAPCGTWTDTFQCIKLNIHKHAVEYLGPAIPPVSRCRDGSRKVAVSAEFRREYDEVAVRMNDGSAYYMDGYFWLDNKPVFDVVGLTIPEIKAAQKVYRDPAPEENNR